MTTSFRWKPLRNRCSRDWGSPPEDKKHVVYDAGHVPLPRSQLIQETLDWLDRYLGPIPCPPETLRANYLNDVSALLAEVETLREQQSLLDGLAGDPENLRGAERKVSELRADIERQAARFHVRTAQ